MRSDLGGSLRACLGILLTAVVVGGAAWPADSHGEVARPEQAQSGAAPLIDRVLFGAFVGEDAAHTMVDDPQLLSDFEQQVGAPVQVASYFYQVGDVFPGPRETAFADGGRRSLLLAWHLGSTREYRFTAWSAGRFDDYLRRIGRAAAQFPYPIYVRPWPEMNADWVPFQPTTSGGRAAGGTPREFVQAWRHVVDIVRAAGGTNIQWVFNPTADVYAETTDVRDIWPGRQWVDVLGLDGYNWGNLPRWRSFSDIFRAQYDRLTSLASRLPVWVCEFGSREPTVDDGAAVDTAHDKGEWLQSVFSSRQWPRIKALVAFDVRKERDWRFSSSPSALAAVRTALAGRAAATPDSHPR